MKEKLKNKLYESVKLLQNLDDDFSNSIEKALSLLNKSMRENKILVYGNGGSATQSSHFVAELVNRFYKNRPPINAIALTTDIANLTSIANDFNYEFVFSRQVEAIGTKNDVSIGITTSGTSKNVLTALRTSKNKGLGTIALCGNNIEVLKEIGVDVIISINTQDTPLIQETHLFVLHFIAEQLENTLTAPEG
jgi:D-sedoheptulose 7-phosphate isomerase